MLPFSKELDDYLLDLAWSLWTELGVAGVKRNHHNFLITLEELILLTATLAEEDPRLRDESLDWCSQYHRLFSISRLKLIMKNLGGSLDQYFSNYAATLNSLSGTSWPVIVDSKPLKVILSCKSCLRPLESPALLNIRARSIFGPGARADLVTYFLMHKKGNFSAADLTTIGYSKRNLAEILDEFSMGGLFDKLTHGNQRQYRLAKNEPLLKVLSPIPKFAPPWELILKVVLSLRDCIKRIEGSSESTKFIEIRNLLIELQPSLQILKLTPPPFQTDFKAYMKSFRVWLIEFVHEISQGNFKA